MSIEKHERSPSFRTRQKTAKVNHNSKLLPTDFFPKTMSQSPKKRPELPCSAEVLDWYQRDESREKPKEKVSLQHQLLRLSHNRPSLGRINFCMEGESFPVEKQRYVHDYYHQIKEKLGAKLIQPQRIEMKEQGGRGRVEKVTLIRPLGASSREREQKRVRVIRSEAKSRERRDTSQSLRQSLRGQPSPSRRSLRQLPKRGQSNDVGVGFDGMVTFSRFK